MLRACHQIVNLAAKNKDNVTEVLGRVPGKVKEIERVCIKKKNQQFSSSERPNLFLGIYKDI